MYARVRCRGSEAAVLNFKPLIALFSGPALSAPALLPSLRFICMRHPMQATDGRPLSVLAYHLFSRTSLMERFHISDVRLARFLVAIEDGYPEVSWALCASCNYVIIPL